MASQHQFKRYKNMHVLAKDLTLTGDLSVAGTTTITGDTAVADDDSLILGTGNDTELLWSTGDASNHAAVVALGASQALHITDVGAKATDWNVSADTNPTLYIHSDTTPATDYLRIGAHSGTAADIDVVGGTTLNLKIAGTAEVLMTASVLDLTSTNLQMQASGKILDDNGNELVSFVETASAVNELTVTNAATGNPVALSATGGDTDVGITIASKGAGYARVTTGGFQVHSTAAVTATADGTGTGLIPAGTSFVVVTSDNADKQISLPAATVGDRIRILVGATGCELISSVAAHKVNDVVVGATNEAALTATSLYDCQYVATNTWVVVGYTKLGAVESALVPDALA